MQKIATKVFIYASLVFGVLGIVMVVTNMDSSPYSTGIDMVISKIFFASIFVILSSFALSVAGKYLNGKF